jgi:rhodanese-related sulfurtransferase
MSTKLVIIIIVLVIIIGVIVYWALPGPEQGPEEESALFDSEDGMQKEDNMQEEITYMDVSPAEAKELIDTKPELIVIDVSPNYDNGHLPGAVNYYVGDGSLDEAIPSLDKDKEYLVYCHIDSAAISGAQKLIDAGFTKVYRLEGNYSAWVDAGYPIEK